MCVQAWLLACLVCAAVPCSCVYRHDGEVDWCSSALLCHSRVRPRSSDATNPGGEIAFAWWMFQSVPTKEQEIAALETLGGIHGFLAVHHRSSMLFIAISFFFFKFLMLTFGMSGTYGLAHWSTFLRTEIKDFFFFCQFSLYFVTSAVCRINTCVI